jgi:hypothetical protein
VPLDDNGKQKIGGVLWEPSAYIPHIKKGSPKWLAHGYDAVIGRKGLCVLQCQKCFAELSISNPSQSVKQHTPSCAAKQERECIRKGIIVADDAPGDSPAKSTRSQTHSKASTSDITRHLVSSSQRDKAIKSFALFLYTSTTPFQRAENEHLRQSYAALGVDLPGEKVFRTRLLLETHDEVRTALVGKLKIILVSEIAAAVESKGGGSVSQCVVSCSSSGLGPSACMHACMHASTPAKTSAQFVNPA